MNTNGQLQPGLAAGLRLRWKTGRILPWRCSHLGGPLNTMLLAPLRRPKLLRLAQADGRDDITVIIGVRNRADDLLCNALQSIRLQSYPSELVRVVVVDYSSQPPLDQRLKALADQFGAQLIRIEGKSVWNKSHCLNVAIRQATTRFILCSDSDVLLAPNFLEVTVATLRAQPLQVVYSQCLDLPESLASELGAAARTRKLPDLDELRKHATPRSSGACNPGIQATYTCFYHLIRGYDEFYEGWGSEDNDLARRMLYLGLSERTVKDQTFYLHQWHPKHQGLSTEEMLRLRARNAQYLATHFSIRRNGPDWGQLP